MSYLDENYRDVDPEVFVQFNLNHEAALRRNLEKAKIEATLSLELGGRAAFALFFENMEAYA